MVDKFLKGRAIALIVVASMNACFGKQDAVPTQATQATGMLTDADLLKLYDPSSLAEVRNFSDLPDSVQVIANRRGMAAKGEGPDERLQKFLVGGLGKTSALVAYEQFGYVPIYMADAYVKTGSDWVVIRSWKIGSVATLDEVKNLTQAEATQVAPPDR